MSCSLKKDVLTDSVDIETYRCSSELAEHLATRVARQLRQGIEARGEASLALSGGNTPKMFLENLSHRDLPWEKVIVTLVDDRWVDPSHPDSNACLLYNHLLKNRARLAHFLPLTNECSTPFDAVGRVQVSLNKLPLPFDAVVLGMGEDGHTASYFPFADNLSQALDLNNSDLCIAVKPPLAPYDRMTLTLSTVLNSHFVALHFEGRKKWQVFQGALGMVSQESCPVSAVLRQTQLPINVFYTG